MRAARIREIDARFRANLALSHAEIHELLAWARGCAVADGGVVPLVDLSPSTVLIVRGNLAELDPDAVMDLGNAIEPARGVFLAEDVKLEVMTDAKLAELGLQRIPSR